VDFLDFPGQFDVVLRQRCKIDRSLNSTMLNNDGIRSNTQLGTERVIAILRRCVGGIVEGWLARAKQSSELNVVPLSEEQRAVHVPAKTVTSSIRDSTSMAGV
jgi:hypothetical protein